MASAEELPTPTIAVNPDLYYPLDEVLYLEGRAKPDSTIQVNFQQAGAKPINLNTKSDSNGEWVLAERVALGSGDWEVRARIIESSGATSAWSNPRLIKAVITGFVIGGVTVKFAFLVFLLVVVLFVSGVLVFYFFSRSKSFKKQAEILKSEKEHQAAESVIEHNFDDLRRSILEELNHLELKIRVSGGLSAEEEEHRAKLLRDFRHAEEEITRKLKDIP